LSMRQQIESMMSIRRQVDILLGVMGFKHKQDEKPHQMWRCQECGQTTVMPWVGGTWTSCEKCGSGQMLIPVRVMEGELAVTEEVEEPGAGCSP